jgi:hypothetical protein
MPDEKYVAPPNEGRCAATLQIDAAAGGRTSRSFAPRPAARGCFLESRCRHQRGLGGRSTELAVLTHHLGASVARRAVPQLGFLWPRVPSDGLATAR